MSRVPRSTQAAIDYFQSHLEPWENNLTAIGLTQAQLTAISSAVLDAEAAFAAVQKARLESKAATVTLNNAMETLRGTGALCLRSIVVKAEQATSPNSVYAAAQIDPPAPPEPVQPPEAPTDFVFTIETGGALGLAFKSKTFGGRTFWAVERKIGDAAFAPLGSTTDRTFVDVTLPAGTPSVTYRVRGYVGAIAGSYSVEQTVQFGVSGGGGMTAVFNGASILASPFYTEANGVPRSKSA
jgi:hypothetical protein